MTPMVSLINGKTVVTLPDAPQKGGIAYGCWLCRDSGHVATVDQFGNPWGWRCRCPAGTKAAGAPQMNRNDYITLYSQQWPDLPLPPY